MRRAVAVLTTLWLLTGCGVFGPKGPGSVSGRVEAQGVDLSGAVLQVNGTGIRGFSAAGGSLVYSRVQGQGDSWRVVLVNPDGAGLDFKVEVEDVASASPSAIVFDAADVSNQPVDPSANVHVSFGQ